MNFSAEIRGFPSRNSVNLRKIFHRVSAPALQTGRGKVPTAEHFPRNTVVSRKRRDHFHPPSESSLAMQNVPHNHVRTIFCSFLLHTQKEETVSDTPQQMVSGEPHYLMPYYRLKYCYQFSGNVMFSMHRTVLCANHMQRYHCLPY